MREEVLGSRDRLKQLGKAAEVDHVPALWLTDFLAFSEEMDEAKVGTLLRALGIEAERVRVSAEHRPLCPASWARTVRLSLNWQLSADEES